MPSVDYTGIGSSQAARLSMKSAGVNPDDPMGVNKLTNEVMNSLKAQGIEADPALVKSLALQAIASERVDKSGMVMKATDPE